MNKNIILNTGKILGALVIALTLGVQAFAGDKVRSHNVSDNNLALKGYDAVAYFNQGKPVPGVSRFSHTFEGHEYRFSTATNRDKFAAAPNQYKPQYGGFCAFGASVGLKLEVDPEAFDFVGGKLYLNNTHKIRDMWLENPTGRIKVANGKWKKIQNVSAAKLSPTAFED